MNRLYLICAVLLLWTAFPVRANNVKIVGDVKVNSNEIVNNKIATIKFTVEWENSWRDEFNYDAVYLFLKFKVDGDTEKWNHLYLQDEPTGGPHIHTVGSAFDYTLAKSGMSYGSEGMFIFRKPDNKTYGKSQVAVELKWDFTVGTKVLNRLDFENGKVFVSAMAIETVYVPRGGFKIGDGHSPKSFTHNFVPLPDKYNVLTDKYEIISTGGKGIPYRVADRLNDIYTADFSNTSVTNMWIGEAKQDILKIDFGKTRDGRETNEKKRITYFAIEGHPSHVPNVWKIEGDAVGDGVWTSLYESGRDGKPGDWCVDMVRTYPATRAVKIPRPGLYRGYRIVIESMVNVNAAPAIKTLAMSEANIESLTDSTVLTWNTVSYLGTSAQSGWVPTATMSAPDGENWAVNTTTNGNYPNGYPGFYTMKYELTQEQFVAFLNKLTYDQQKQRTIGQALDLYGASDYVFGDNKKKPTARNGIIVASRPANKSYPITFANNLNSVDDYAQDGDGQTIACNFLSAGDMLAYADWCGLRPLTEMEYEKMCHRPYPFTPVKGEYAWNTTKFTAPTGYMAGTEGKTAEKAKDGNANAGGALKGPIRTGSFAKGAANQESAGASFWGVMDLSGNLSEIYYNADAAGRVFQGIGASYHGNGVISDLGYTDVSTSFWPAVPNAFAFRGGNYTSKAPELASSDRRKAVGNYAGVSTVEQKDTTLTFRLGYTAPTRGALASKLTLQNGLQNVDTICSGEDYYIKGDLPKADGAYTFLWFKSENRGTRWEEIEGENGQNLSLKNLINDGTAQDVFLEYRYYRKMFTGDADATSPAVTIRVVNHKSANISRQTDTLDHYDWMKGRWVQAYAPQIASINWSWNGQPLDPQYDSERISNEHHEYFAPRYADYYKNGKIQSGVQDIAVEIITMRHCVFRDTLALYIKPEPIVESSDKVTCGNTMIDMRDKKIYPTVMIGGQCWMTKNLDYIVDGSRCYANNTDNCEIYGRLYNWNQAVGTISTGVVVKGICPDGWHMPSNPEWTNMWTSAGSNYSYIRSSSSLWGTSGNPSSNNDSRFSALPGGGYFWRYTNSESLPTTAGINARAAGFYDVNTRGWWWTSTSTVSYWYRNRVGNYDIMSMPMYTRLDYNANMTFNVSTGHSTYPYLNYSIFAGNNTYQHLSNHYDSQGVMNGYNATAENNTKSQFYMSVRCVKD